MKKLEDLKFAHKMTTQGEWDISRHGTPGYAPQYGVYADGAPSDLAIVFREADGDFMCMAHNMMPTLLEAVNLLEILRYSMSQYDDGEWFLPEGSDELITKVDGFLEKLW